MDYQANLDLISQVCAEVGGNTDLLLMPEMFNTGYTMMPSEIPVSWQEETILALKTMATNYDLHIAGSIPFYKNGKYYNSFIFVSKDGLIHSYDKIHLFNLAGENKVYEEGNITTPISLMGWKILPLVCYDLRFPYLCWTNDGYDIIIYSANWPAPRISHWQALLKARAIENQCYVIGINRTGTDQNGFEYPGASTLIDFNGDELIRMDNSVGYANAELNKTEMLAFRKKLPFLNDRKSNFII